MQTLPFPVDGGARGRSALTASYLDALLHASLLCRWASMLQASGQSNRPVHGVTLSSHVSCPPEASRPVATVTAFWSQGAQHPRPVMLSDLGFLWRAVRDLNPRPLACHEPRARSGAVVQERFVPLNWTFAKVQFTSVQLDSPALLTRLLTREPLEPVEIWSHSAASAV